MKLQDRLRLCWRILREKPGNCMAHLEREIPDSEDEMNQMMKQNLRELVLVFSTQGHSGFSASYARSALEKLLAFEPLGPLTGEDPEWVEVSDGLWQNNRCSRVFKEAGGRAYDTEGIVFRDEHGGFTSKESRVYITFPYTPTTEYREVLTSA